MAFEDKPLAQAIYREATPRDRALHEKIDKLLKKESE